METLYKIDFVQVNRLTNKGKRDKIKGIGGEKGQCVHNFVTNSRSAEEF